MVKNGKILCCGCAMAISLLMLNPMYAEPETIVDKQTESEQTNEKQIDANDKNNDTTDSNEDSETQEEMSIDEETGKIKISEKAVSSYKQLQEIINKNKMSESGYNEIDNPTNEGVATGDIMIKNDKIYICIKLNKKCTWWILSDDTLQYKSDIVLKENDKVYRKSMNQTAYPTITGLIGYNGETLSTVTLPQNYKWINENTLMTSAGIKEYPAMYIPEDFINDKAAVMWIGVEIKPHQGSPEIGTQYTVKYVPHLTAQMVGIPEKWEISSTEELKIGENHVVASYGFPDGTVANEDVTVIVEKGEMNIQGVMLTVIENTRLTNDILPQIANGKLEFDDELNKIITQNTTLTCTFNPTDTEHYNSTYDIPVIINVIPQAIIKSIQSSSSKTNETENNNTTTDNKETGENTSITSVETTKSETVNKNTTSDLNVTSSTTKNNNTTETATTQTTTEATTEKTKDKLKSTSSSKKTKSTKKSNTDTKSSKKKSSNTNSNASNTNNTTKTKDLSLNSTNSATTESTTEKKKNTNKKKTDIKNLEGSKNTNTTTDGRQNKIQMRDIDLTKKTSGNTNTTEKSTEGNNKEGKVVVETIDLTKQKSTENIIIKDDSTKEATSEVVTEGSTEKNTTTEIKEKEKKTKDKKDKKDKKIFNNKPLLIFVGVLGIFFAALIIFIIKIIQRNKMR